VKYEFRCQASSAVALTKADAESTQSGLVRFRLQAGYRLQVTGCIGRYQIRDKKPFNN